MHTHVYSYVVLLVHACKQLLLIDLNLKSCRPKHLALMGVMLALRRAREADQLWAR